VTRDQKEDYAHFLAEEEKTICSTAAGLQAKISLDKKKKK